MSPAFFLRSHAFFLLSSAFGSTTSGLNTASIAAATYSASTLQTWVALSSLTCGSPVSASGAVTGKLVSITGLSSISSSTSVGVRISSTSSCGTWSVLPAASAGGGVSG